MENKNINIDVIIKIFYKNIVLIIVSTILVGLLSGFFAFTNKSFKSEITLFGYDRILNEIGENSQFSLNSFEFLQYLKENTKVLKNKNDSQEDFFKEMSNRLKAQSEAGNPTIKVSFSTKDKSEGEAFTKEYTTIAQNYLLAKKNNFLGNQIKLLEEQYEFLNSNVDLRTTKDSLTDTLVSRLAYYRLLQNDTNPMVRLLSASTKSSLNKKIVLAFGILLGFILGLVLAFLKEFSKTLDWKMIKEK